MSIFYVNTSSDSVTGSLRYAVDEANRINSPSAIEITSSVIGSIILTGGEIKISANVTIRNNSGHDLIISGGELEERLFNILSSSKRTVFESSREKFSLIKGRTNRNGGAIYVASSSHTLILDGVIIEDNKSNKGGGIYTKGKLILNNSTIKLNFANIQGGGIWAEYGVSMNKSSVTENTVLVPSVSSAGGGIFVDNGDCILNESSISQNEVSHTDMIGGSGGGIVVMTGNIKIQNKSHVDNNSAYDSGGVQEGEGNIYVSNQSSVNGNQSFNANRGSAGGGGITIVKGNVFISKSEIIDNTTVGMYSGGIVSLVGDVIIEHSRIIRNSNRGPGGGVAMNVGNAVIHSSIITHNTGASLGGGIVTFTPNSYIHVTTSKISNNILTNDETIAQTIGAFLSVIIQNLDGISKQAQESGGSGSTAFLKNVPAIIGKITEVHNELKESTQELEKKNLVAGGGIASLLLAEITIINSNIENNLADKNVSPSNSPFVSLGGGIFNYKGKTNLDNSTVSDNTANIGGGIWNGTEAYLVESEITKNKADNEDGGGIYNAINSDTLLLNTKITKNIAGRNGGGILNDGNLTLLSSLISENKARDGGGIYSPGTLLVFDTKVVQNHPNNIVKK